MSFALYPEGWRSEEEVVPFLKRWIPQLMDLARQEFNGELFASTDVSLLRKLAELNPEHSDQLFTVINECEQHDVGFYIA